MRNQRDDVKAGLFVIFGVVLMLLGVFLVADFDRFFAQSQQVKVYFTLNEGLQGLKEGAEVTLGDQPVGQVEAIEDVTRDGRVVGKVISFTIPDHYQIAWDARVELAPELIGGGTKLNIRSVGAGKPYRLTEASPAQYHTLDPPPPPGALAGAAASSTLTRSFGIDDQQRKQIANIIANIDRFTSVLAGTTSQEKVAIEHMVDDLKRASTAVRKAAERLDPLMVKAEGSVDNVNELTAKLRGAGDDVKAITGDVRQRTGNWLDKVDTITETGEQTAKATAKLTEDAAAAVTDIRNIIGDAKPKIARSLDNVVGVTKAMRDKTLAQVNDAIATGQLAMKNTAEAALELRNIVKGQRPVLERALANAQLTSDQLKLAAIEIRRSPWRLLYTPGDEELETDNLYDAARSFALAAGSLDATAKSLQAIAVTQPNEKEQITKMVQRLEKLFGKFEEAESEFWDALKKRK